MKNKSETPPDYLNETAMSNDDMWEMIYEQFQDYCMSLNSWGFENEEKAIGKRVKLEKPNKKGKKTTWVSPSPAERPHLDFNFRNPENPTEHGKPGKHHSLIQYSGEDILMLLREDMKNAKILAAELTELFNEKELTLQLITKWGLFCKFYGTLETAWVSPKAKSVAQLRAAAFNVATVKKDKHRIWFAHAYLALHDPKQSRSDNSGTLETHIQKFIDADFMNKEGFGKQWFQKFFGSKKLGNNHSLTSSFDESSLSIKRMKKIVENNPRPPIPIILENNTSAPLGGTET